MGFLAFILPAVIYYFFRTNLDPLIATDAISVISENSITLINAFRGDHTEFSETYYKPIQIFLASKLAENVISYGEQYFRLIVAVVALLIGLSSFFVYRICYFFTSNQLTSCFAAFLFIFSAETLTNTWYTVWTGSMLLGLISISGIFLAYLQYHNQTGSQKQFWLWSFVLLCIVGPYIHELAFIPLTIILAMEAVRIFKKRSYFPLSLFLLLSHAFFPKALVSLLGLYRDPINSWLFDRIFGLREVYHIGDFMFSHDGLLSNYLYKMSLVTPGLLINEFPIVLWFCVIVAGVISVVTYPPIHILHPTFWKSILDLDQIESVNISPSSTANYRTRTVGGFLTAVLLLSTIFPLFQVEINNEIRNYLLNVFLLCIGLLSFLRFGPVLAFWFLAAYFSTAMIDTNHEYLVFALPPLAIICALYFRDLVSVTYRISVSSLRGISFTTILIVVIFILSDHVGNVQTSSMVLNNINAGHQQIALWITRNIPHGSVFLSSGRSSREVFYRLSVPYADYTYDRTIVDWTWHELNEPDLHQIIDDSINQNKDVYFIDIVDQPLSSRQFIPSDLLILVATIQINNLGFDNDPFRVLVDSRYSAKSMIISDWKNTYARLGQDADRYIWRIKWNIHKLDQSDSSKINRFLLKALYQVPRES